MRPKSANVTALPSRRVPRRSTARSADKSIRFAWNDGTPVEVYFTTKAANKTQITVQHRMLATKADASKMKDYWAERLTVLAEMLVHSPLSIS